MRSEFRCLLAFCLIGVRLTASAQAADAHQHVAPRHANEQQLIDKLLMPKASAHFMIGKQEVSPRKVAHPLNSQRVEKNWVWVGAAWIRADEVLPLSQAETYYTSYLREHTRSQWAYYCRAICRRQRGDFEGAIVDLNEAIQLSPNDPTHFNARGNTWFQQNSFDKALHDYDRALELDVDFGLAYYGRGAVRERLGIFGSAIEDFERAVEIDPQDHRACGRMAWVLSTCPDAQLRDGRRAVQLATRACELSLWQRADPIDTLAAAYAECNDFGRALKYQEQALRLSERDFTFRPGANERIALYRQRLPCRQSIPFRQELGNRPEDVPSPFRLLANDPSDSSKPQQGAPAAR